MNSKKAFTLLKKRLIKSESFSNLPKYKQQRFNRYITIVEEDLYYLDVHSTLIDSYFKTDKGEKNEKV